MKLSELTLSRDAYAGALEIYLPDGNRSSLNQLPVRSKKKMSKKEIKSIVAKEEKKKKKKKRVSSFFKI